jgi:hypothetical protein
MQRLIEREAAPQTDRIESPSGHLVSPIDLQKLVTHFLVNLYRYQRNVQMIPVVRSQDATVQLRSIGESLGGVGERGQLPLGLFNPATMLGELDELSTEITKLDQELGKSSGQIVFDARLEKIKRAVLEEITDVCFYLLADISLITGFPLHHPAFQNGAGTMTAALVLELAGQPRKKSSLPATIQLLSTHVHDARGALMELAQQQQAGDLYIEPSSLRRALSALLAIFSSGCWTQNKIESTIVSVAHRVGVRRVLITTNVHDKEYSLFDPELWNRYGYSAQQLPAIHKHLEPALRIIRRKIERDGVTAIALPRLKSLLNAPGVAEAIIQYIHNALANTGQDTRQSLRVLEATLNRLLGVVVEPNANTE